MRKGITKTVDVKRIEKTKYEINGEMAEKVLREHFGLPDDAPLTFIFYDEDGDYGQVGSVYGCTRLLRAESEFEVVDHIGNHADDHCIIDVSSEEECPHEAVEEDSAGRTFKCADCGYGLTGQKIKDRVQNKTKIIYMGTWTEYERGWGQRPDGGSLHLSEEAYKEFVTLFTADRSEAVPDEYIAPTGALKPYEVPVSAYKALEESTSNGNKDSDHPWFNYGVFITNSDVKAVKAGNNPFKDNKG